jgi:Zn finger protein HypA/HybF involved in hydrogenase expression
MSSEWNRDQGIGERALRKMQKEDEKKKVEAEKINFQAECSACKLYAPFSDFVHRTQNYGILIFCPVCGEKKIIAK